MSQRCGSQAQLQLPRGDGVWGCRDGHAPAPQLVLGCHVGHEIRARWALQCRTACPLLPHYSLGAGRLFLCQLLPGWKGRQAMGLAKKMHACGALPETHRFPRPFTCGTPQGGVLALDEPTTNLDAANIRGLAEARASSFGCWGGGSLLSGPQKGGSLTPPKKGTLSKQPSPLKEVVLEPTKRGTLPPTSIAPACWVPGR